MNVTRLFGSRLLLCSTIIPVQRLVKTMKAGTQPCITIHHIISVSPSQRLPRGQHVCQLCRGMCFMWGGSLITVWGVRKATCVSNTPVCFSALQDTLQRMECVRSVQTLAPNVTKGANAVVSFSTLFITDWHFIIITTKLYNWLLSRASEFLHSYTTGNVFKRSHFCSSIIHFIKNNTVKTEIFSNIITI